MYIRIVLGSVPNFFTSNGSFSSGVGYVMRPILLIMWTAFQSFILRDNNNNNNNNNNTNNNNNNIGEIRLMKMKMIQRYSIKITNSLDIQTNASFR